MQGLLPTKTPGAWMMKERQPPRPVEKVGKSPHILTENCSACPVAKYSAELRKGLVVSALLNACDAVATEEKGALQTAGADLLPTLQVRDFSRSNGLHEDDREDLFYLHKHHDECKDCCQKRHCSLLP